MQVVDHQHERLLELLELVQEPLYHHRASEARRRADPLDDVVAGGVGQGVDHVKPEPLRVTLAALDGDPRDSPSVSAAHDRSRAVFPLPAGAQTSVTVPERRLTAARRERVAKGTDRQGSVC